MNTLELDDATFNKFTTISEREAINQAIAANEAFTAAMNKAIKRGKVNAVPGTFVDTTPAIGARRLRGDVVMSPCGSPAQMCMESGGAHSGAQAMK